MDDAITELDTPKHPERTAENNNCKPPSTVTCSVDSERLTKDLVDQENLYGDQNFGERLVLTRDTIDRIEQTCGGRKIEPPSINSGNRDIETTLPRKRGAKPKDQVTGSWALRSKSREKSTVLQPDETAKEGNTNAGKKRRERKKKRTRKSVDNDFSRKRVHLRYLLHRIKYEQNLIDAYSAEGWKGQSMEKLKPEKELQRAHSHILLYKAKIRALFRHLDQSLTIGKLPEHLFNSKGEINSEDIFCAKCGSKDLTLDNDIILCDGGCERGFHQYCLEPPLLKEHIPPGNEPWLCPGCDCKVYCIDMLKDFQETKLSISDGWEKIFPEAAEASSGKKTDDRSLSGDSEDDDYDPNKPGESSYVSASDGLAASVNDEKYQGLFNDDSEDDDFDPSAPYSDSQGEGDGSSSDFTSDSEDPDAPLDNAAMSGEYLKNASKPSDNPLAREFGEENTSMRTTKKQAAKDELPYFIETSGEAVTGKRRVERLDYRKLNDETFANLSSDSNDEDFEDGTARKRRMRKIDKTEATSPSKTSETNINSEDRNIKQNKQSLTSTRENTCNDDVSISQDNLNSASNNTKRSHKRIGEAAKQRLCQAFNKNQYPEKSACENMAEELGLTAQRVRKWFENARWSLRHRPGLDSIPKTND